MVNESKNETGKLFRSDKVFLSDELIQAYYHRFKTMEGLSEHSHDFYELNVIIKGQGTHRVGEKTFVIKKGMAFLIPPFVRHSYTFENNDFVIFHILFHNMFFDKYHSLLKNIVGFNLLFEIEPYVRLHANSTNFLLSLVADDFAALAPSFKRLVMLENKTSANTQREKEFLTLYIISVICDNMKNFMMVNKETDASLFYILKAAEYIQNNYAEKITLTKLCREANMSKTSFLQHFKNNYNCTPSEYLNDYRINQSKIMLRETDKNVATIAQNCGFFDSSHFIRCFSKKVSVSPAKYRENILKEKQSNKETERSRFLQQIENLL